MKTIRYTFAVAALALAFAPLAVAAPRPEDPAPDTKAVVDKLEEARKSADISAMRDAIKKAVEVHNGTEDAAIRGSLQDGIARILKDKKATDARVSAADALGALNDHKGAWKHLQAALPDPKVEAAEPVDIAVIKASGAVAEDSAIPVLLKLLEKAKDKAVAREAASALGGFTAASKAKKIMIIEGFFDLAIKMKPSGGGQSGKAASPEASARWNEVAPAFRKSLNSITNKEVGTWEEWETLYKDNKKTLQKLLPES